MIKTWHEGMSDKETKDLAYWERNMLALAFADPSKGDGWYYDDVDAMFDYPTASGHIMQRPHPVPRFGGWRRVISLRNGSMTFHVPDDFPVGNLPQIERNWDGHTTKEKWERVQRERGITE
jgi:hypothetical protein